MLIAVEQQGDLRIDVVNAIDDLVRLHLLLRILKFVIPFTEKPGSSFDAKEFIMTVKSDPWRNLLEPLPHTLDL